MKLLELFSGSKILSNTFKSQGHQTFTIDNNPELNADLCIDILHVKPQHIIDLFGRPDVIFASPDCSTYSVARIGHHRTKESTGNLAPKTEYAMYCDIVNQHLLYLIHCLQPKYYFIENPRGGLRKMFFMQSLPRHTVWYCQYGDFRAKPTDIWTNHPNPEFKPPCHNGNKNCHHEPSPRGSQTGTQKIRGSYERSIIPQELCNHILKISEN